MEKVGSAGLIAERVLGKNKKVDAKKGGKRVTGKNRNGTKAGFSNTMKLLVDSLDVDGDGEISFTELVDGLMRRRQEAKSNHSENMKRAAKEAEKRARHKAARMKVKGY